VSSSYKEVGGLAGLVVGRLLKMGGDDRAVEDEGLRDDVLQFPRHRGLSL